MGIKALLWVLIVTTAGMAQAAEVTLFDLTGQWRGTGMVRPELGKDLREGRCKMQASSSDAGRELTLSGRCATDIGAGGLTMRFIRHDGGRVAGAVASPSLPDVMQFLGRMDAGLVQLETRDVVNMDGVEGSNHFTLTVFGAGAFDLIEVFRPSNGGADIEFVRLHFTRTGDSG